MAEDMRTESGRGEGRGSETGRGWAGSKDSGSVTMRGWSECVPQPFAALQHGQGSAGRLSLGHTRPARDR